MEELLGCKPYVSKRTSADDRPYVEAFFKRFEEALFHHLPSTTGTGFEDYRRKNPSLQACKYYFELEDVHQLTDIAIANYNAEPHESLGLRSPLSYLDYLTGRDRLSYFKVEQCKVSNLMTNTEVVTVRGNRSKGTRPYIQFCLVKYRNEVLSGSYLLVNQKIIIKYDPDDVRIIQAFKKDGTELGELRAGAPWDHTKHSIFLRRAINNLRNKKRLFYAYNEDPIDKYLEYCESKIKLSKPSSEYLEARRVFTETYITLPTQDTEIESSLLSDSSKRSIDSEPENQRISHASNLDKKSKLPPPRFAKSFNNAE